MPGYFTKPSTFPRFAQRIAENYEGYGKGRTKLEEFRAGLNMNSKSALQFYFGKYVKVCSHVPTQWLCK